MGIAASGGELRAAARMARECAVMGQAVTLARWFGTGRRPVTAGQVLRWADIPRLRRLWGSSCSPSSARSPATPANRRSPPLGRWAAGHLAAGLPGPVDPGMPVSVMIAEVARFSGEEQQDHVAWGWLAGREPAEAAREILTAAGQMSPRLRGVAVRVAERWSWTRCPPGGRWRRRRT